MFEADDVPATFQQCFASYGSESISHARRGVRSATGHQNGMEDASDLRNAVEEAGFM